MCVIFISRLEYIQILNVDKTLKQSLKRVCGGNFGNHRDVPAIGNFVKVSMRSKELKKKKKAPICSQQQRSVSAVEYLRNLLMYVY